jgi:hypothetical protein
LDPLEDEPEDDAGELPLNETLADLSSPIDVLRALIPTA